MNIDTNDHEELIRILVSTSFELFDNDEFNSSDYDYYLEIESSNYINIKLKCNDSYCTHLDKIINILTKTKEQKNIFFNFVWPKF